MWDLIAFRVDPELNSELVRYGQVHGVSKSSIIRHALRAYFDTGTSSGDPQVSERESATGFLGVSVGNSHFSA